MTELTTRTGVDTNITLGPDALIRCDLHPDQPPILSILVGGFELMITIDADPTDAHVRLADTLVRETCAWQLAVAAMVRRASTPNGPPSTAVWPPGRAVAE